VVAKITTLLLAKTKQYLCARLILIVEHKVEKFCNVILVTFFDDVMAITSLK